MEIIREGSSTFRPPILVGKNYSYCKPKTISFLKSLDGRAWRSVVTGWETLMVLNSFEDDETRGGTKQSNTNQGRQLQNNVNSGDAVCWSSSNIKGALSTSASYTIVG
ncbi:uncharacterized protein E5676_scaffold208G001570 [Cucumis melo var. makuwa]|uniref:Uncharacterized protein n=1 Tax=Cucumis melo var. makuwa TaxID=1194695 RepID=A0A5D3E286_CUCMM|nr:uncharacterized protein E5676_scaffold208G001570 [Cucumis melo var. makuwa]